MAKRDMQRAMDAIAALEPRTKSAQLRGLIPEIERKLEEGAALSEIHLALAESGLELTFQTLKTYLYRHRKRVKKKSRSDRPPKADLAEVAGTLRQDEFENAGEALGPELPKSIQDLDRLMRPDPVAQAQELAHYERLARKQNRSRT